MNNEASSAIDSSNVEKYPSWPKGHPWKGCRSLIAARGFKSLLLRKKKTEMPNGISVFSFVKEYDRRGKTGEYAQDDLYAQDTAHYKSVTIGKKRYILKNADVKRHRR